MAARVSVARARLAGPDNAAQPGKAGKVGASRPGTAEDQAYFLGMWSGTNPSPEPDRNG